MVEAGLTFNFKLINYQFCERLLDVDSYVLKYIFTIYAHIVVRMWLTKER